MPLFLTKLMLGASKEREDRERKIRAAFRFVLRVQDLENNAHRFLELTICSTNVYSCAEVSAPPSKLKTG